MKIDHCSIALRAILVLSLTIILGCGRKQKDDFHIFLEDAKGLTVESEVRWRGMDVGKVRAVSAEDDRVRIDVVLDPQYRDQLHEGVKAKPSTGFLRQGSVVLELYGGSDQEAPILPQGSEIPEAGFYETMSYTHLLIVGGIFVFLLLLLLVAKGVKKLIAFVVALVFLIGSLWFLKLQWDKHHEDLIGAETEVMLGELAHSILQSPEAIAVWESMRGDIAEALAEAKTHGSDAIERAKEKVGASLQQKTDELKQKGEDAAAEQISKLKTQAEHLLNNLKTIKKTARKAADVPTSAPSRTNSAASP